jgi:desulfoferrodoxin (superoxide reductase-like protein)
VQIKSKDWPLKQFFIASSNQENHSVAQPLGCVFLGKKSLSHFSLLFFFFKKQKIEHQTKLNPVTLWTPNTWKAYLCPTRLNTVPVRVCLEKSSPPFLPTVWFQNCLWTSTDLTGEHHTPHMTTPTPKHNLAQLVGRLKSLLNKTEKHRQWIVLYHWQWLGCNTEITLENTDGARSQTLSEQRQGKEQVLRTGVGQQANLPEELNSQQVVVGQGMKTENGLGEMSQPSRAGA